MTGATHVNKNVVLCGTYLCVTVLSVVI